MTIDTPEKADDLGPPALEVLGHMIVRRLMLSHHVLGHGSGDAGAAGGGELQQLLRRLRGSCRGSGLGLGALGSAAGQRVRDGGRCPCAL